MIDFADVNLCDTQFYDSHMVSLCEIAGKYLTGERANHVVLICTEA